MNHILITLSFILFSQASFSQIQWFIDTDSVAKCEMIKSGKFVNKESKEITMAGYYIVFEEGYATEYSGDAQSYLKSKIEFLSDCEYKSTVIEVTIPNYPLGIGTIIRTQIIRTKASSNQIEIKSTHEGKDYYFVLEKVEE